MNALNRDDVQRALDRIASKTSWNVDAIIDGAERFAMENGYTDRDFTHEDGDAEYCFECVKPETYVYDEDGELDCGNGDSEYWLWLIRDKKTGHDIYRKHSPQYEEKFKDTRKASANKARCVKADEKKEVFVYKAMDVNGNGVYKIFYDDGTYEILKGGKASERKFNDYDKRVSMETLRHATAPPKGKARKASAQKVKAAQDGWTYYEDLTHEEQEIYLYAENDGRLYESKTKPIMRNMARKINNGTYDKDKAVIAWEYLVKDAIEKYNKEFDDEQIRLNPASRKRVAQVLAYSYEDEVNDMAKEMKSGRKNANRGAQRARKVKAALSKEKVIEIAENLYWGVRDYGDVVEFEFSSPAGEDFVFSVDADNVADNVWEYAQNFDAEEHAREVMDMPGAPSLRELLEDADEIKRELELLADEIWGAEVDKIRMEEIVGSARRKSGARRVARKKVRAQADDVVDVADLAQFIKNAVRTLQTSDATNTRYTLDENLAVYVGWSYDDGGSMGYGIPDDSGEYVIYAGVKLRNDSYWADYDWLDYPYDKETGDVWDNGSYIAPDEDYDYLARELSKTYQEILKEVASGHDLGYGVDDYIDESVESSARRRNKKNVNADLKIICDLGDYQPWQGAVETYNRIKDAGKLDDFEILMEEAYPEGLTMTGLNDILWFEPEWVFEMLGMDNGDEDDDYDEYED